MKKLFLKDTLTLIIISLLLLGVSMTGVFYYLKYSVINDMKAYLQRVYEIERNFIENIPVYEDYATAEKERELRKYLQDDHLRAARSAGVAPIRNENEIQQFVSNGSLVKLNSGTDKLYFFYNVREDNRYLTPGAYKGLERIALRFQGNLNKRKNLPQVKIAVSSAIRSSEYQNNLKKKNVNATVMSTHSYGTSFDIFYDEFFVALPAMRPAGTIAGALQEIFHKRMGFLLGASLRRQFRSVLMETLLQLQDEGALYAILEGRQRCYHVTIKGE